jgi:SNF2 family DNA or RNA helicase
VKGALNKTKERRGGQLMPDDYETIAQLHGTSEKNVRFIETSPRYTRYKRLDELKAYIDKDVFSARKEDCLDLPPKVYEKIYVDMTPEQARIYKSLKQDLMAEYADKEVTVANKVALTTRLMQVIGGFFPYQEDEIRYNQYGAYTKPVAAGQLIGTSNAKLDALISDLDEVADGTKIIIWAHFVSELKYLYAHLNDLYDCCLYYGGTPDYERKKIIEDFKSGVYDIFIGNAATAGFGLNLQNATVQYFFSNSFRTEDRLQAEDRSHRIGVKSMVVYKDVIMRGTIDERIYESIKTGRDLNDYFKATSLKALLTDDTE